MSYMQGKNLGGGGGGVNVIENLMGQGQSMKQQQQPPPRCRHSRAPPFGSLAQNGKEVSVVFRQGHTGAYAQQITAGWA